MASGVSRRSVARIVVPIALALLFGVAALLLFLIGMCTGDGICGDSETQMRAAYAGAIAGAALAGGVATAAARPRRAAVLAGAAVAAAVMSYAVTQVRA